MTKLSIITINYNDSAGLQKTMESVFSQTFTSYEYIVIDGGSTDGSAELIQQHAAKLAWWCSEKDRGIYHAMNKGIQIAKGEYCLFLNSGDYLYKKDVLETVFNNHHSEDIIYGDMMIDYGNGTLTAGTMPDHISFYQMYTDTLWHPVSFIKHALFHKFGNYDESYRMVADYEFFFKAIIIHNVSLKHVAVPISVYNMKGFSSKPEFKSIEKAERERVIRTHLPESVIAFTDEYIRNSAVRRKEGLLKRLMNKLKNG